MKMHMDNFISMDRHFVYLTCMDCHFTYQTCIDHWLDWYISVVTGTPAHGTPVRIGDSNMKKKEKRKEWWRRKEEGGRRKKKDRNEKDERGKKMRKKHTRRQRTMGGRQRWAPAQGEMGRPHVWSEEGSRMKALKYLDWNTQDKGGPHFGSHPD